MSAELETVHPRRRRYTREEFERGAELGFFGPEERLELIGGEVFEKMSPQKGPHATAISLLEAALRNVFSRDRFVVRVQLPLALGEDHEPEPDMAVVSGSIRDFTLQHPTAALLVVEVADTTLRYDRTLKASMYASAGIACYWIVNLVDRVVEVHLEPAPMSGEPFGHHYRSITRHPAGSMLAAPDGGVVAVADILP